MNTAKLREALDACRKEMPKLALEGFIFGPWMRLVEALAEMVLEGASEDHSTTVKPVNKWEDPEHNIQLGMDTTFPGHGWRALTTEDEANLRADYMRGEPAKRADVARLFATIDGERAAKGILLPGWTCSCGVFNGSAKQLLTHCRTCGKERPT